MLKRKFQTTYSIPWWGWMLAVNLLLVAATVAHHKLVLTDSIHFYLRQVDLAIEMNFAAWWSGILLLGLGLLSYEIFSTRAERSKLAWLLLAIAFTSLSLDEIGSIHERIEDWLPERWLPIIDPYIPIALLGSLLVPYPLLKLFQKRATRKTAGLLLAGLLLLASIAFQERIEGVVDWGDWWSLRLGIEEGTELLGMFVCYCGLVNHTWNGNKAKGLSGVLPNPLRMKYVPAVALGGLGVHLSVSAFLIWRGVINTPIATRISFSEHTLVWYPVALSATLGLAAFWQYRRSPNRQSAQVGGVSWLVLSAYFLIYSAVVPYVIPLTTDKADAFLSAYLYAFYVLQLVIVILLFITLRSRLKVVSAKNYLTILALILLVALSGLAPYSMAVRYALPGIFTLLLLQLFFLDAFKSEAAHK